MSLNKGGAFLVYRAPFFKSKDNKEKFYRIVKGGVIKLGKILIRILEIKLEKEETQYLNNITMIKNQIEIFPRIYSSKELPKFNLTERKNHSKNICRICY